MSQFRYIFKMEKCSFTNARNMFFEGKIAIKKYAIKEQPSSVRQCSRLLHAKVLGPIINTSVFSEFSSKKLLVIQFLISTIHSVSFANW